MTAQTPERAGPAKTPAKAPAKGRATRRPDPAPRDASLRLVDYETTDPVTGAALRGTGIIVATRHDERGRRRFTVAQLPLLGVELAPDEVKDR